MYTVDFASASYESEPVCIRVALLEIDTYQFKVLLNPTDQKRCLRMIVRSNDTAVLDKSFAAVSYRVHCAQTLANMIAAKTCELGGAKNVNARNDGNNKFAANPEREGLHYHVLGRFNNGDRPFDVYTIEYKLGTKGDIPLGVDKLPLSKDKAENEILLAELCVQVRQQLEAALKQLNVAEIVTIVS